VVIAANAIAAFLGLVLAVAATAKIYDSRSLRDALRVGSLNNAVAKALAAGLPAVELVVAGALVVGSSTSVQVALATSAALFALFTLWILVMLARGLRPTCGCFGVAGETLSVKSVLRNAVLMGLAIAGSLLARQRPPLLAPSAASLMIVTAGLSVVALGTAFVLTTPHLIWARDQLTPGES
jgi:hypothetical protein